MINQLNEQQFLNLQPGGKYTMWCFDDFGFPYCLQIKIVNVECCKYAQYDKAIELLYLPKGARKIRRQIILPYENVIIWPGWVKINSEMWGKGEERNGLTVCISKGRCFDAIYIKAALESSNIVPVVQQ